MAYPSDINDLDDFFRAPNRASSVLSSAVDDSTLTIPVSSASTFSTGRQTISIDDEIIIIASKSGNNLTVEDGGRGAFGTVAAAHLDAAAVRALFTGAHHEGLAAGIVALETELFNSRKEVKQTFHTANVDAPGGPSTGDRYITGPDSVTPANAWDNQNQVIAEYNGSTWDFFTPQIGFLVLVNEDQGTNNRGWYRYGGATWEFLGSLGDALTPGSVVFTGASGELSQDNANFFYDSTTGFLGLGTNTPECTLDIVGGLDITHVHSAPVNPHVISVDVDAAGFGDVSAMRVLYKTGAHSAEDASAIYETSIDEAGATGGTVIAHRVTTAAVNGANIFHSASGPGVSPIGQFIGTFGDMDSALNNGVGSLTEFTTSDPGGANNADIFVSNNDTITLGDAAKFNAVSITLETVASGSGIKPTFELSTGIGTWVIVSPIDGTDGFRSSGLITFSTAILDLWFPGLAGEYLLRITRTQGGISTVPTEDIFQITSTTQYGWDEDAFIRVAGVKTNIGLGSTTLLQAYDTLNTVYVSGITMTAGNPPTFDLDSSFTIGGNIIRETSTAIDLTTDVTGTLPIGSGGTGQTTEAGIMGALSGQATADFSFNNNKVTQVSTPLSGTDGANKAYVDAAAAGIDWKESVRVATTANITLSGEQTIDGVLTSTNRILVKNQSIASENGIYVTAAGAWARSTDADADAEVTSGLATFVSEGTANASSTWVLTTADPITVDTTSLTFVQNSALGQITAGGGLDKAGSTIFVDLNDLTTEAGGGVSADLLAFVDVSDSNLTKNVTVPNFIANAGIAKLSGNVFTGTHDFGGADDFEIPNSATPVVDTNGQIAIDTTVTDFSAGLMRYYSGEEMVVVAMPTAQIVSPTDTYVVTYDATADEFQLLAQSGILFNIEDDAGTGVNIGIIDSATTNAVITNLTIKATSSGTPANGIGAGAAFIIETAAGNEETTAVISSVVTDNTATAEYTDLSFDVMSAGSLINGMKIVSTNSSSYIEVSTSVETGGVVLGTDSGTGLAIGSDFVGLTSANLGGWGVTNALGSRGKGAFAGQDEFIGWGNNTATHASTGAYAQLWSDVQFQIDMRMGVDPQTFNIYTTYSSSGTNYERLALTGSAITVETGGTGTDNIDLVLNAAGTGTVKVGANTVLDASDPVAYLDVESQTVTGGAHITPKTQGTKTTGTFTVDYSERALQYYTNGGAHTLAPDTSEGFCRMLITNNASAGAITTSGWTVVDGDAFDTVNGNDFLCYMTTTNNGVSDFSQLTVKAMQ